MPAERMAATCVGFSSMPEKMKRAPMTTPTMVPGGLKDCAKLRRRSEVAGEPNCATKGLQAVSRIDAPLPTTKSAMRKGKYSPVIAAGQKRIIPSPKVQRPTIMPALYPQRRMRRAAGMAMQK